MNRINFKGYFQTKNYRSCFTEKHIKQSMSVVNVAVSDIIIFRNFPFKQCFMIKGTCNLYKKRTIKLIIWIAIYSMVCLNSFSQYKKNVVVLDLAGKSFYYFDISYERYLSEKFHLGAGAGLAGISTLYLNPDEMAREFNIRFPVYVAYALGKKKHHAISELGLTIDCIFSSFGSYVSSLWPFISIGYEYKGDKVIIRVPVYLGYIGENEWYPSVMPWAGLSIGVPF